MKKRPFAGWTQVFHFTLTRQMEQKGYRLATILTALILCAGIAGGMFLAAGAAGSPSVDPEPAVLPDRVVVAGALGETGAQFLAAVGAMEYQDTRFASAPTVEEALADAGPMGLVLVTEESGESSVLLSEETALPWESGEEFSAWCGQWLAGAYAAEAGADAQQLAGLLMPSYVSVQTASGEEEDGGFLRELLTMLLPYAVMMLVYFFVLIYGQAVANSVILEKTSKLMDTFLISVSPRALLLGKMLAVALAGFAQLSLWIGSAVLGLALGRWLVLLRDPASELALLSILDALGVAGAMISPWQIWTALLLLAGGFLLYCSLSAVGGALASKPEDLNTTNVFFTACLVLSLLAVIARSGSSAGMVSEAAWMNYVPFTAVLVTPGRVLLGQIGPGEAALSLVLILACSLAITALAGKLYALLAFHRGDPPKPVEGLRMLFAREKQDA